MNCRLINFFNKFVILGVFSAILGVIFDAILCILNQAPIFPTYQTFPPLGLGPYRPSY